MKNSKQADSLAQSMLDEKLGFKNTLIITLSLSQCASLDLTAKKLKVRLPPTNF